jgi:hypothetical protein
MAQIQPLNDESIEQDPDHCHSAAHEGDVTPKQFGYYKTEQHGHLSSRRHFANLSQLLASPQKGELNSEHLIYLTVSMTRSGN